MKKILVIGSGPIIIGQAAEFDYAGTQACKSLREEGYSVVLINSNPATIMTDAEMADAVYIEPLTVDFCERVIAKERPEGLLPTLGGQTGLNLASQLADAGILEKYGVKMLGTPLSAIRKAEDRELFRALMREIQEPVPESWIVETEQDLKEALDEVPYPCIVRPAYTLGGTGGGVAYSPDELWEIGRKGLKLSMRSQLMIERSLLGWKEVEYEVMRDSKGNCITVCNMENFDPMGVHTGDSIVVAPSQTLSDIEYHMMRAASLKIINALGIEGGCNVQMALNPDSFDYYIIEVNPRVSRSSALASKATGYPIARVAAKIAVGKTLDEIENMVTRTTKACFEPALDYCVVKIPRWPFDKFASGDRRLSSQMKATGEVMAIDRTFESAFMKAIRGLEVKQKDLRHPRIQSLTDQELESAVSKPTDERLWAIAEALRRGWGIARVYDLSRVDTWFLEKIQKLLMIEGRLVVARMTMGDFEDVGALIHEAFEIGFPSPAIKSLLCATDQDIDALRSAGDCAIGELMEVDHILLERLIQMVEYVPGAEGCKPSEAKQSIQSLAVDAYQALSPTYRAMLELRESANSCGMGSWIPDPLGSATCAEYLTFANQALQEIERQKIQPVFKMVDTCAGEFESATPYYYGTFETEDDAVHA
jgi:carbamoyl-phosphate synthase large subunit